MASFRDYLVCSRLRAVAELIKPYSPRGSLQLLELSQDFESAAWKKFSRVFMGIKIRGCCFHFYQAISKKIQKLGLSKFNYKNPRIRLICRKLMSLNLLSHLFIRSSFNNLKYQAPGALTIALFNYVENFGSCIQFGNPKNGTNMKTQNVVIFQCGH